MVAQTFSRFHAFCLPFQNVEICLQTPKNLLQSDLMVWYRSISQRIYDALPKKYRKKCSIDVQLSHQFTDPFKIWCYNKTYYILIKITRCVHSNKTNKQEIQIQRKHHQHSKYIYKNWARQQNITNLKKTQCKNMAHRAKIQSRSQKWAK